MKTTSVSVIIIIIIIMIIIIIIIIIITRGPKGPVVAHLRKRSKVTVEPFTDDPRGII